MALNDTITALGNSIINLVGTRASRDLDNLSTTGVENIASHVQDITAAELNKKLDKDELNNGYGTTVDKSNKTTLTVASSNPDLTITNNYTGTKDTLGVEVVELVASTNKNPNKVTTAGFNGLPSKYMILNGYLYLVKYSSSTSNVPTYTKIDSNDDWTIVAGSNYTHSIGSSSDYYFYAIRDSKLYVLYDSSVTQIGTESGWTAISGFSRGERRVYAFGIKNGELYKLKKSSIARVGTETGWTIISGFLDGSSACGIRNGQLYTTNGSTVTQIDSNSDWTTVIGSTSDVESNYYWAYGIRNSKLYAIQQNTITQVGTDTGWTTVAGNTSTAAFEHSYGIRDGKLYLLQKATATQIGTDTGWTTVIGSNSDDNSYSYGIKDGKLYALTETTVTQVGTDTGWTEISGGENYFGWTGLCGIKNNRIYFIHRKNSSALYYDWTILDNTLNKYISVQPSLFDIEIDGTPNNNDKVTLTYNTTRNCKVDINMARYETDWFSIAAKQLYTFTIPTTNEVRTLFANGKYPNCYLVAKVITAAGDFAVGDIIYIQYRDYIGNSASKTKDIAIGIKSNSTIQVRTGTDAGLIVNNANGYSAIPIANCQYKIIIEGLLT